MKAFRLLKVLLVTGATVGLLARDGGLQAASPASAGPATSASPLPIPDVKLAAGGCLSGLVVDVQGIPVSQAAVVLRQWNRQVAVVQSDRQGQFLVSGLPGGTYQLVVGPQARLLRAWAAETAPPQAKSVALVVVGDQLVRGQMAMRDLFAPDAIVLTGLITAAIALPLSMHHSQKSQPQTP